MNNFLKFSIAILFVFTISNSFVAAKGYEIKIKIKELPDTEFFLSNFYAKNQYYKDTAKSDKNGLVVFSGDIPLEEGMYALVYGNRKIFDFFVIEQEFSIETDTVNTTQNMKVKGSKENELFFQYVNYLRIKEIEVEPLQKAMTDGTEEEKKAAELKLLDINKQVDSFQTSFMTTNKNYFVAKFLKGMREIEVPEPPKDEQGNIIDSSFQYRYYREHFFDNIDFTDGRYLRTPVYHQRLATFIQKATYQIPDSIVKSIDIVCEKAKANHDLFRYSVSWITNTYEQSKIMGMDAIFVHMAEKYYLTDAVDWMDSTQKAKVEEQYHKAKPLLIGKIAPNIILMDTTEKVWHNLHKLDAKFTLVYIWSPTCGHCKKVTPKMHELYLKYKDYGFKVFAVSTEFENVEWKKYIIENKLTWLNVSDNPENPNNIKDYPLNYRANYDVYSTPKIYLLDKDKRIVAKRLESEQLDDFLGREFGLITGPPQAVEVDLDE